MTHKRKPRPIDPRDILPGDYLHITVPHNRHLDWGVYKCRVESIDRKPRHGQVCTCCLVLSTGLDKPIDFDDPDFEDKAIVVMFRLTIYKHHKFKGQCFLGQDEFPVEYRHEPNLLSRLRASMPQPTARKERTPYADL